MTATRDFHEFALEATVRLGIRCGKADNPRDMWALASGSAAAHAASKLLARLAEVDPDGVEAFAQKLADEGEMPELADDPCETAERMGLNPQPWIDAEHKPATPVSA
jgi:hypothetical protein